MKNIIIIQHTQSAQHINGMIGSWDNWDLTEHGIEQAKRISERLSKEIKNDHYIMYSSDLLRAKHTFAKSHALCGYVLVNADITPPLRYQLFAKCARVRISFQKISGGILRLPHKWEQSILCSD